MDPAIGFMSRIFIIVSLFLGTKGMANSLPTCDFPQRMRLAREAGGTSVRPDEVGYLDSTEWPLRLHYQDGIDPAYVTNMLTVSEEAWRRLFVDLGYMLPHSDGDLGGDGRFDIYLVTDLADGVGGYAGFSGYVEDTPRQDAFGYLVIADDLSERIRRFVVTHEMFHTSQMAYDWWEDLAFMEASATWVTEPAFPEDGIFWRYFPYYQAQPWLALDFVSLANPYQYGMGLFVAFLEERYGDGGGGFLKQIWEHSIQNVIENEPDFLDAIAELTATAGGLDAAIREFGEWRLLIGSRDDGQHFREGAEWERVDPYFEAEASPGMTRVDGRLQHPVGPLGHAFLRFPRVAGELADYQLQFSGSAGARLAIDGIVRSRSGVYRSFPIAVIEGPEPVSFTIPADPDLEELFLVITNLGFHYDADSSPWTGADLAYRFEAQFH